MKNDLISIIIPVYNVGQYLEKCLESVINQTYKKLEIILVNDGSTDNSVSICKKYERKDKRIKLINKENGGVSSARNCGLDICIGSYVTFIDSDDYVEKDYIETLYKKLKKYNVDIVFSNAINIYENGKTDVLNRSDKDEFLEGNNIIKEILNEKIITSVCWGNLYKSNLVKDIRFDIKMRICEDMKFLLGIIKKITKSVVITEQKYYYVVRNSSTIHSGFNEKWYDEIDYSKELLDSYKETDLEKYMIKRYVRVITSCMYLFDIKKEEYNKLKSLIKPYFFKYLFSDIVSWKLKIMYLLVLIK